MPVTVNYLDDGLGIEIIASGVVTGAEIIEANKEVYTDHYLWKQKYQIIDRTDCTQYQVYAEDIETIAEQDNRAAKNNPHIIIAIVSPTPLQFGMTRMWQAYLKSDTFRTKIFNNRKDADRWVRTSLSVSPIINSHK